MNMSRGIQASKVAVRVARMMIFLQMLTKNVTKVIKPLKLADAWSTDWRILPADFTLIFYSLSMNMFFIFDLATDILWLNELLSTLEIYSTRFLPSMSLIFTVRVFGIWLPNSCSRFIIELELEVLLISLLSILMLHWFLDWLYSRPPSIVEMQNATANTTDANLRFLWLSNINSIIPATNLKQNCLLSIYIR